MRGQAGEEPTSKIPRPQSQQRQISRRNQGSWRLGIQQNVVTGEEAGSLRQIQPMFAVFEYRGFHALSRTSFSSSK